MKFTDIAGHSAIKTTLANTVNTNKLGHAYLFIGKNGLGALPLAIAFAQFVNCENNNQSQIDSCGECSSCLNMARISHPDVHYTFPIVNLKSPSSPSICSDFIKEWQSFVIETPNNNVFDWLSFVNTKADNKQGNISASECNTIIQKLGLKSFSNGYKIQIIWMAEYLKESGNKLLKLIEEPPSQTLLLLITENKEQILNTILSRVQQINLFPVGDQELEEFLLSKNYTQQSIQFVLPFAEGNIRTCYNLLSEDLTSNCELLKTMLNTVLIGKTQQHLSWIKTATEKGKESLKQFLLYALDIFQQAQIQHFIPKHQSTENVQAKLIQAITQKISVEQIFSLVTEVEKTISHIDRNANDQLTLHALIIRLKYIFKQDAEIIIQ